MLFDPKWEKRADPLGPKGLIAWLEMKDPDEQYNFEDCKGGCLMGQFLAFNGVEWCGAAYSDITNRLIGRVPYYHVSAEYPRTFGAALERARILQDA